MPEVADASQLPHGIMGLEAPAFPWLNLALLGVGLVALVLVGWFLWKRWKNKVSGARPAPAGRMDPWQRIFGDLKGLHVTEPWTQEACADYFFRLSFVLREALELHTGLPITGQTLAETRQSLQTSPALSANFQQDLIKFLGLAEQLKFAGQWLGTAESIAWQEQVKTWVEDFQRGAVS